MPDDTTTVEQYTIVGLYGDLLWAQVSVSMVNQCGHGYLRLSDNLTHAWVQVCIDQFLIVTIIFFSNEKYYECSAAYGTLSGHCQRHVIEQL